MISLSGLSALLSYYYTLWLTPSFSVSLLIWIYQSPRLLVVYKAYKATLRVLLRRSCELDRVLATDGHSHSSDGRIRLQDSDDDDDDTESVQEPSEGDVATKHADDTLPDAALSSSEESPGRREVIVDRRAIRDWRVYHTLRMSAIPDVWGLLPKDVTAEEQNTSAVKLADIPGLQGIHPVNTALLARVVSRLKDIDRQISTLLQYATRPVHKADRDYQDNLRKLWSLLKPAVKLESMKTKQWQDLGFQGKDPSTDWRSTGLLGLDTLLHFADINRADSKAQRVVTEAVEGGTGWYPFAIASITITDFVLQLLRDGALHLLLIASPRDVRQTVFALTASLFLHFHSLWRYLQTSSNAVELRTVRPTVMDFERVCKVWKAEMRKWLQRGKIGGWFDSRSLRLHALQFALVARTSVGLDTVQPTLIEI